MPPKLSPEEEVFKKYISQQLILLVDPNKTSRSGMFKILANLGAQSHRVITADTFQQANDAITEFKPNIIFAEFELEKASGLDLLQRQRAANPASTTSLFILVTKNSSQSAVAQAAEEDIDAFVLKPFTPEVLRKTVMNAALIKIKPPDYLVKVEEAKKCLKENKLEEADKVLKEAVKMNAKPSLAHYYQGQLEVLKKSQESAKGEYKSGLDYNKIHYKCMVGLYDVFMEQKLHTEAYDVVKRISQYFPANPKRLSEVLKLAITTSQFDDVEKYYNIFTNLDERNDNLIKYICAALIVCGKYYLRIKQKPRALELFQKAAVTSAGRPGILFEVGSALVEAKMAKEAEPYLKRFPADTQNGKEYSLLRLLILSETASASDVTNEGRATIQKGILDPRIFEITIKAAVKARAGSVAEELKFQAMSAFPNEKAKFEAAAAAPTANAS